MHYLLIDQNIIRYLPTWDKGTLEGTYQTREDVLQVIGNGLGDDLVTNVTQANRTKLLNGLRIIYFWNKNNKSVIKTFRKPAVLKRIRDE